MTIVQRKTRAGKTRYGVKVYRAGREVWVGTRPTRREAKELERAEESRPHGCSDELIGDFVARWPVDYARPAAATNARNRYQAAHLAAEYGQMRLGDFTRAHARAFAAGRPWAAQVARMIFADALCDDLVGFNPFDRLRLPRTRGLADAAVPDVEDLRVLSAAAIAALPDAYAPHFAAAMEFSFYAGVRAGELFALQLEDVDLAAGMVHVRHSLSGAQLKTPKSGRARDVVLGDHARAALQAAAATSPRPRAGADSFVFLGPAGNRLSKPTHWRAWAAVRAASPDPRWESMSWHLWRHACATHLLDVAKLSHADVAQHLGHRDASLVLSLYGHPSQRLAADRIRDALSDSAW